MKRILTIVTLLAVLTSCEKEIDVNLNSSDPKIVIEGNISDQKGPYYVMISKTVNVSGENSYPTVSGAQVIISDNTGTVDILAEIEPGKYQTHTISGVPGRTYTLRVILTDGKRFNAVSTMPQLVNLDSLTFDADTGMGTTTFMSVPVFTDPTAPGNSYRFIQTVNGEVDDSYFVQNDIATNGVVNELPLFSPEGEIESGDAVALEMMCIDAATYSYFYTLAQIEGGFGGGATPSNPPTNITGDYALGIFTAYTSQKKMAVAK